MKKNKTTNMILLFFNIEIILIPLWMYLLIPSTASIIFGIILSLTLLFSVSSQFKAFEFYMSYVSFGVISNNLNQKSIYLEYHWNSIEKIELKETVKNKFLRTPTYVYTIYFKNGKEELLYLKSTYNVLHHEFELYVNTYINENCFPAYTRSHKSLANKYISYKSNESFKYNLEIINKFKHLIFYIKLNTTLLLNILMFGILIYSVLLL